MMTHQDAAVPPAFLTGPAKYRQKYCPAPSFLFFILISTSPSSGELTTPRVP